MPPPTAIGICWTSARPPRRSSACPWRWGAGAFGLARIRPSLRARNGVEGIITLFLSACTSVAILTAVGIALSVLFESIRFFQAVPVADFLFGLEWSPQTAIREEQVGSSGAFGAVPLFVGTMLISLVAMLVAVPIGLMSAIYLSEYATPRFRAAAKPLLEILAGIPTVVYGFFAALIVAPIVRDAGASVGLDVASESALVAGRGPDCQDASTVARRRPTGGSRTTSVPEGASKNLLREQRHQEWRCVAVTHL